MRVMTVGSLIPNDSQSSRNSFSYFLSDEQDLHHQHTTIAHPPSMSVEYLLILNSSPELLIKPVSEEISAESDETLTLSTDDEGSSLYFISDSALHQWKEMPKACRI